LSGVLCSKSWDVVERERPSKKNRDQLKGKRHGGVNIKGKDGDDVEHADVSREESKRSVTGNTCLDIIAPVCASRAAGEGIAARLGWGQSNRAVGGQGRG
jgi:hypothetical protein